MPDRRKIIGVVGSSRDSHDNLVNQIVPWIAESNFHLLTGARGGVMEAASKVFCAARDAAGKTGCAIGILPDGKTENEWVEILVRTHLPGGKSRDDYANGLDPRSRNWIEVRTCDAIVAFPGGGGTRAEITLASMHKTPIILFGWPGNALKGMGLKRLETLKEEPSDPQKVFSFINTHVGKIPKIEEWPS